ncbi:MAG: Cj0069 family protein [Flavisolibacter sp.]
MKPLSIAFLVYGEHGSSRNALTEEKYKDLANAFISSGFSVQSVLYNDEEKEQLYSTLSAFDAILVWVNPIEQGKDRTHLNNLLSRLSHQGCLVSAHPNAILKMGTKEVLFRTKQMDWGGNIQLYTSYNEFEKNFPKSLEQRKVKVLKQYRGNGGNGVFKISHNTTNNEVTITPAQRGAGPTSFSWNDFFNFFKSYFENNGMLIEQEWNANHQNGMVRCYLCGNKVAGFGYQEINALYEINTPEGTRMLPPGSRYYFSENCGLFADLKQIMETFWVPKLQDIQSIPTDLLPIIWDADFFINQVNNPPAIGKYSLCEINVSSVSPFPPSAIPFIVKETSRRLADSKD